MIFKNVARRLGKVLGENDLEILIFTVKFIKRENPQFNDDTAISQASQMLFELEGYEPLPDVPPPEVMVTLRDCGVFKKNWTLGRAPALFEKYGLHNFLDIDYPYAPPAAREGETIHLSKKGMRRRNGEYFSIAFAYHAPGDTLYVYSKA